MQSKFAYLEETKRQIRQAIIDKGVSVSENDTFRNYASKIAEIQVNNENVNNENVNSE